MRISIDCFEYPECCSKKTFFSSAQSKEQNKKKPRATVDETNSVISSQLVNPRTISMTSLSKTEETLNLHPTVPEESPSLHPSTVNNRKRKREAANTKSKKNKETKRSSSSNSKKSKSSKESSSSKKKSGSDRKKAVIKGAWTDEEDKSLVSLVAEYGPKRWSTIAKRLPGRIGKQVF